MKFGKIARDLLKNTSPTLLAALALPPPFNVIASGVATAALNKYLPEGAQRTDAQGKPVPTDPVVLERVIEEHQEDPQFAVALRQAEMDLKRYEIEAGIRFAEIELEDKKRAGEAQRDAGVGADAFTHGMRLVWLSIIGIIVLLVGLFVFILFGKDITANTELVIAAFGLLGTTVGFVSGIASTVVAYYWGSSKGSKDKTDALSTSFKEMGTQLAHAQTQARAAEVKVERQQQALMSQVPQSGQMQAPHLVPPGQPSTSAAPEREPDAATPAGFTVEDILPSLSEPHGEFPDGVKWAIVEDGISVEGAPAAKTNGEPKTVKRIWELYGPFCRVWAKRYGVPVELVVATIATETNGKSDSRRYEKHLNDESVGLMQTLVGTARHALGRSTIVGDDLLDPSLSIEAGTAYIAMQRNETNFDPPLVAAAYNAGSVRKDTADANKWKLHCFPKGTGRHVSKYVQWFGDAMRVSREQDWSNGGDAPSFAASISGVASQSSQLSQKSEDEAFDGSLPLLRGLSGAITLDALKGESDLTKEIQRALGIYGYLDPPADGQFGPISTWALKTYCNTCNLPFTNKVDVGIANSLLAPMEYLADWPGTDTWFDKVVTYMINNDYFVCRVPDCKNIVYLEGVDKDGTLNDDKPDEFNDLRCVFWTDKSGNPHVKTWVATTEPGRHFTEVEILNSAGAARVKFGQYKGWAVGKHGSHEALRQVRPVDVHRDFNKDYKRTNDKIFNGLFGINQHWGYDLPKNEIRDASAGCLVGRTKAGHREFMEIIKTDPRYQARNTYAFMTTILPGDKVLQR